jgi:site-specific recombinase XerD
MKGCRSLSDDEIQRVVVSFKGKNALRDRCLVILGTKSGFRISELLSLKVGSVWQLGQVVERVTVDRAHMKKRQEGRTVLLHPEAKAAIEALLFVLRKKVTFGPQTYLFQSQKGPNKPLSRVGAWLVLKKAFARTSVTGKTGTHCLRKTFADRIYGKLGNDLVKTQHALGHRNIQSTISYIGFRQQDIDLAILGI